MVRDILRPIFLTHYTTMTTKEHQYHIQKSITSGWKTSLQAPYSSDLNMDLPLIPEVSIHYRCGDNTVGHYGYLAFPAFKNRIPANASTIYVMTESPSRKTNHQRTTQCNAILGALFDFLRGEFLSATVVIMRGANMYDDMTRLALSQTTICSVSSFCIWPALASTTTAYFPITRLIAKATAPVYTESFHWLDQFPEESVLSGVKSKRMDNTQIIKFLLKPRGFRPLPPQYVLDKQRGNNNIKTKPKPKKIMNKMSRNGRNKPRPK
jgi:hypothetical protein